MRDYRARVIFCAAVFCALLWFSPLTANADTIGSYVTLELTGTGNLSYGSDAAYPYYLSVDGSSISMSGMCVSFDNDIARGESWVAQVQGITGTQEEEAAWLFNDDNLSIAADNNTQAIDDQWAAWEIFSANARAATAPADGGAATQLAAAISAVSLGTEPASFYQQFVIYIPEWGWPTGDDVPQNFIALAGFSDGPNPPDSPEPSSLILLGTGLLGLAGIIFRRNHSSVKHPHPGA
ncbi:MAG: PEP-CTERM sorting domain-containing protein [Terracidiphilus sp.]|jgi:uncharacterized protein YneR